MSIQGLSPVAGRTLAITAGGFGATTGVWQPAKDPASVLDYWLDASLLVAQPSGPDLIQSVACSVSSHAANQENAPVCTAATDGTMVLVNASGGENGDDAWIGLTLAFTSGRIYAYAAVLRVRSAETTLPGVL